MYLYLKALHIIFIVTWFAGMFYMPRLFIYNREAQDQPSPGREILQQQFRVMMKRLWWGITWPSAIITLMLGPALWFNLSITPGWLLLKLGFVSGLYIYFFFLHRIFRQQIQNQFKYSSQQLRIWNEVATVFLFAIVFLAVVKNNMSAVWGLLGLVLLIAVLMIAIGIYKRVRQRK